MESYWSNIVVLFEDGFWVAYFETARQDGQEYRVARHVFGPEPSDAELRDFILHSDVTRLRWSAEAVIARDHKESKSPKRRIREAAKAVRKDFGASRAREAVKADIVRRKEEKGVLRKACQEQGRDMDFTRRREKRKRKRRGH